MFWRVVRVNEKNLIPFTTEQSREEAEKNGRKGGKKSGEVRRRKAAMKTVMKQLLSMPVLDTDTWNGLSAIGVDPEQMDNQTALLASVLIKGIKTGDFRAMQAIAALTGEDNDAERLKLAKKELNLKEKAMSDSSPNTAETPLLYKALEEDGNDV